jgi:hypothetical protein
MKIRLFAFSLLLLITCANKRGNNDHGSTSDSVSISLNDTTFPDQTSYQQTKSYFLTACKDWRGLCNIKFEYHSKRHY